MDVPTAALLLLLVAGAIVAIVVTSTRRNKARLAASGAADGLAPALGGRTTQTNSLAITAFVLAFIVSVVGAILGHVALAQIKRTGEGGHGLALAATIIGWTLALVSVGLTLFRVFVLGRS